MSHKKLQKKILLSLKLLYSVSFQYSYSTADYTINLAKNADVEINSSGSDSGTVTIGNIISGQQVQLLSSEYYPITIENQCTSASEFGGGINIYAKGSGDSAYSGVINIQTLADELGSGDSGSMNFQSLAYGSSGNSGNLRISTESTNGNAGEIQLYSLAEGSGYSGYIGIGTQSIGGTSGGLELYSCVNNGNLDSGPVSLYSYHDAQGYSGNVNVYSESYAGSAGDVNVYSYVDSGSNNSGTVQLYSESDGSGDAGAVYVGSYNYGTGNSRQVEIDSYSQDGSSDYIYIKSTGYNESGGIMIQSQSNIGNSGQIQLYSLAAGSGYSGDIGIGTQSIAGNSGTLDLYSYVNSGNLGSGPVFLYSESDGSGDAGEVYVGSYNHGTGNSRQVKIDSYSQDGSSDNIMISSWGYNSSGKILIESASFLDSNDVSLLSTSTDGRSGNINLITRNKTSRIVNNNIRNGGIYQFTGEGLVQNYNFSNFSEGYGLFEYQADAKNEGNMFMVTDGGKVILPATSDILYNPISLIGNNPFFIANTMTPGDYFTITTSTTMTLPYGSGSVFINGIEHVYSPGGIDEFDLSSGNTVRFAQPSYMSFNNNVTLTWTTNNSYKFISTIPVNNNNPIILYKDVQYAFPAMKINDYFTIGTSGTMTLYGNPGTVTINNGATNTTYSYLSGQQFAVSIGDQITFNNPVNMSFSYPYVNNINYFNYILSWQGDSYPVSIQYNKFSESIVLATKYFAPVEDTDHSIFLAGNKIVLDGELILNGIASPTGGISTYGLSIDQAGKIYMSTGSTPTLSSMRYKDNIEYLDDAETSQIYDINTYSFNYKNQPGIIEYGVIVEELVDNGTLSSAVRYNREGQPDSVSYNSIMIAMLREMQKAKIHHEKESRRLREHISNLENASFEMQSSINDMQSMIYDLQNALYVIQN